MNDRPTGVSDRDWSIYQRRHHGAATLALVANEFGLSQERVRQICIAVQQQYVRSLSMTAMSAAQIAETVNGRITPGYTVEAIEAMIASLRITP